MGSVRSESLFDGLGLVSVLTLISALSACMLVF